MVTLGLIGILQALFFPGLLFLYATKLHQNKFQTALLAPPLSGLINFCIVYLLLAFHLYSSISMTAVLLLELLIFFIIRHIQHHKREMRQSLQPNIEWPFFKETLTTIHLSIFLIALFTAMLFFLLLYTSIFMPFESRDAFISFHGWAQEMYLGYFPHLVWDYPQLISANISLIYTLIRSSIIQCFAHIYLTSFSSLFIALFLFLSLQKKSFLYITAFVTTGILICLNNMPAGNLNSADIPCALFCFTAFALLITHTELRDNGYLKKILYIGAIISAAAALTKQSGIYFAVFYPIFAYFLCLKSNEDLNKSKTLLMLYAIIVMIIIPFYAQTLFSLAHSSFKASSYENLLRHHLEYNIWQRPVHFYNVFMPQFYNKALVLSLMPLFLITGIINNRCYRNIFVFFALPFFFIWLFFFSYDARNLAIIVPFLGLIMANGIHNIINWISKLILKDKKITLQYAHFLLALLFITIAASVGNLLYPRQMILPQQISGQMSIGIPKLNDYIFKLYMKNNFNGKMITNEQYLKFMPNLYQLVTYISFADPNHVAAIIRQEKPRYMVLVKGMLTYQVMKKTRVNVTQLSEPPFYKKYKIDHYLKNKLLPALPKNYRIITDNSDYIILTFSWKKK